MSQEVTSSAPSVRRGRFDKHFLALLGTIGGTYVVLIVVMLLADVHTIRDVVLFPTLRPEVLSDADADLASFER